MKIFLLVICFLFTISPNLTSAEDSLLVKWQDKSLSDSIRLVNYNAYIWENHIDKGSDSIEFHLNKLTNFSKSKKSELGLSLNIILKGVLLLKSGEYEQALDKFQESLNKGKKNGSRLIEARSQFLIATTYYYQGIYEQALFRFKEVITIYKELDYKKDLAATYVNIGSVYKELADYKEALENFHGALHIYIKLDKKEEISKVYNNLGLIYKEKGEYVNALNYFDRSINIKTELGDRAGKASTFHNIGLIYMEFDEHDKALEYINKSIEIEKENNNIRGLANSYVELGDILLSKKKYDEALEYLDKSLGINEEIGNISGIAYSLLSIGKLYFSRNDNQKAKEYFSKCLIIYEETGEKSGIADALSYLGLTSIKLGNTQAALTNCKRSEIIAMESQDVYTKQLACDCLYQAYKGLSQPAKALQYYEKFIGFSTKMKTLEASKDIQRMMFQKAKLADSLKQEEKRLTTKLVYENRISEENQQRNIALGIGLILIMVAGGLFSRNRYISKTKNEITNERDRSEKLLLNILPAEIAKELKEKGKSEARDFEKVSILFTDFKEFTQASEKLTAHQLIDEINYCFEQFDLICDKYNIEKIKTIGDSYMVAGGLPKPSDNSTKNTVSAGIEMAAFIINRKTERENAGNIPFEMRIGIHTGPVVAGIVGVKKFQYDIWGDTVNTASRMETAGVVGKVNISQSTYELLKHDPNFVFEYRGKVQAKGKGEVDMYFVERAV